MIAGGLLEIVATLAGAPMLGMIAILAGALAPALYSWSLARQG